MWTYRELILQSWKWKSLRWKFKSWKNQSESWKSPGKVLEKSWNIPWNLFLIKGTNPGLWRAENSLVCFLTCTDNMENLVYFLDLPLLVLVLVNYNCYFVIFDRGSFVQYVWSPSTPQRIFKYILKHLMMTVNQHQLVG